MGNDLNSDKICVFFYMWVFFCVFITIFCVFCEFRIVFDSIFYISLTQNTLWCANRVVTMFLNTAENLHFQMSSKKIKKIAFYVLYLN